MSRDKSGTDTIFDRLIDSRKAMSDLANSHAIGISDTEDTAPIVKYVATEGNIELGDGVLLLDGILLGRALVDYISSNEMRRYQDITIHVTVLKAIISQGVATDMMEINKFVPYVEKAFEFLTGEYTKASE